MGPTIQLLARNAIMLEGLRTLVGESGIDVAAATTVIDDIDYRSVPKKELPDVLVVDAELIGDNPFTTIGKFRRCHPELHIIVMIFDDVPFPPLSFLEIGINGMIHAEESRLLSELVRTPLGSGIWLSNWAMRSIVELYTRSELFGLSKREITVMELVEDGMSNKAIAQHLSLSVRTVDFHVHNALGKLGATNRTEAVKLLNRARYGG